MSLLFGRQNFPILWRMEQCTRSQIHATFLVVRLITRFRERFRAKILLEKSNLNSLTEVHPQSCRTIRQIEKDLQEQGNRTKQCLKSVGPTNLGLWLQNTIAKQPNILQSHGLWDTAMDDAKLLGYTNRKLPIKSISQWISVATQIQNSVTIIDWFMEQDWQDWMEVCGLDYKFIANLHHLLLQLRTQMMEKELLRLAYHFIDQYIGNPSKRLLKYGGDKWCSEFSDSRRPPSTTWPWSIKPSLAVIWGVCWMFTPYSGDSYASTGESNSNFNFGFCTTGNLPKNSNYDVPLIYQSYLYNPNPISHSGSLESNPSLQALFQHSSMNTCRPVAQTSLNTSPPYGYSEIQGINPSQIPQEVIRNSLSNDLPGNYPTYLRPTKPNMETESPIHIANTIHGMTRSDDLDIDHHSHHSHLSHPSPSMEPFSPKRGHTVKRHEEPPKNDQGRMICKYSKSSCPNVTFDRKCEWSKHMDKHERPYKCDKNGCEKLQGFTYSGGLLRHQREVHKMHGGTKETLHCPFENCKRNSGSGFTRKENLSEHIRRVHRGATDDGKRSYGSISTDPALDNVSDIHILDDENIDPTMLDTPAPSANKRRRQEHSNGLSVTPSSSTNDLSDIKNLLHKLIESNRFLIQQSEDVKKDIHTLQDRVNKIEGQYARRLLDE